MFSAPRHYKVAETVDYDLADRKHGQVCSADPCRTKAAARSTMRSGLRRQFRSPRSHVDVPAAPSPPVFLLAARIFAPNRYLLNSVSPWTLPVLSDNGDSQYPRDWHHRDGYPAEDRACWADAQIVEERWCVPSHQLKGTE